MELRPYQIECIKELDSRPEGRYLVSMGMGTGKTVIMSRMKRNGRMLILSHRDELVRQPGKYFDCSFGIERGEDESGGEEVISASVQTLSRDERLFRFSHDEFDTVVIDEAHHAAAPTYRKIVDYFSGARRIIGFTATPRRGDGIRLDGVFDSICFTYGILDGIRDGYLSDVKAYRVQADYDLKNVSKVAGDFNEKQLEKAITDSESIHLAARTYVEKCHKEGRHTLLFALSVNICSMLLDEIRMLLPEEEKEKVCILTGKTPAEERKRILEEYQKDGARCIINCMVLTEGTDLPVTDCIMNMRPTANDSLYQQMAGRGLRLYPGKDKCLLLDIVGKNYRNKRLCQVSTLAGIDPDTLSERQERFLEDSSLLEFSERMEKEEKIRRNALNNVRLRMEEIDSFTGERLSEIISDDKEDTLFDGIYMTMRPGQDERYRIDFFGGHILISEPDIIGRCTLSVYRKTSSASSYGKADMKIEEAEEFTRKCLCIWGYGTNSYLWDKKIRDEWKNEVPTSAQMYRIDKDFETVFGIPFDKKRFVLNKSSASELIDLIFWTKDEKMKARQILEGDKKKGKTGNGTARIKRRIAPAAGPQADMAIREEKRIKALEEQAYRDFGHIRSFVDMLYEEQKKAEQSVIEEEGIFEFTVQMPEHLSGKGAYSIRSSCRFVINELRKRGVKINENILSDIRIEEKEKLFAVLQAMLSYSDDLKGKRTEFKNEDLLSALALIDFDGFIHKICLPYTMITFIGI